MLVLARPPSPMDVSVRLKRVRTRLLFDEGEFGPNLERWCRCCSPTPRGEEAGPPRADARSPPRAGAGRIARPINFTVGSTGSRSTGPGLSGSGEERQEHDRSLASILWPGGRSDPIGSELRGGLNGTEGTGAEPAPLWRSLWRSRVKQQLPLARVLSSNRVRLCREHNERR